MNIQEMIDEASKAAEAAGKSWMEAAVPKYVVHEELSGENFGTLLDMCGAAYVRVRDGRTKFARALKKHIGDYRGATTVPLETSYRRRQEYGLAVAQARAALMVLEGQYGIKGLYVWKWVD